MAETTTVIDRSHEESEAEETLVHDTQAVVSVGRRIKRWLAKHRLTIAWALFIMGGVVFSVWYIQLLYGLLSMLWLTSTWQFWTVLTVNGAALGFLGLIIWRVSLADVSMEPAII